MQSFKLSRLPEIIFGAGSLATLGEVVASRVQPPAKVMIVADPVLAALGITDRAVKSLGAAGFSVEVFDGLQGEPKLAEIDFAADQARNIAAKVIVGLGGGSALDVAKLVAASAASGLSAESYQLCETALPADVLPLIAIPTTAGTGSEVTRTAVFVNGAGRKVWAWGDEIKPQIAILDAELTAAVPPLIAAATGIDALVHAMEAATNLRRNDGSDVYALQAIALIAANLLAVVSAPSDEQARGQMLWGSCLAGVAIDNSGTALAHNISHAMANLAPIAHGRATGLAMLATMDWVAEGNPAAFSRVAKAMGATHPVQAFQNLMRATGMKISLAGEGFDLSRPELLAEQMALAANAPMRKSTVRYPSDADLLELARRVYALG